LRIVLSVAGRREPTGPAKVLLHAIRKDPANVLKALAA
jgi:DNA-binding transcriptional regulator YiaG